MHKRLIIANRLLSQSGILVLTIDDYEVENITLLLNEVFGEENHLGTVVIKNNPQGRSSVTGFQISHEYALFYGKANACIGRLPRSEEQLARYGERDEKGPFEWRNFRAQYSTESPAMVYPIYVDNNGEYFRIPDMEWDEESRDYIVHEDPLNSEHIVLPIDETGRMRTWKWSIDTAKKSMQSEMGVRRDRSGVFTVYYKGRMKDLDMLPYTIWDNPLYSASTFGANILSDIIGKNMFNYPKSVYAVVDSLKVANAKKDSLILDFFAGSGTTLHATMLLNEADGGHRRCILVTNNENNICEEVTYERNKRVIEGYSKPDGTMVPGLSNNKLHYYRIEHYARNLSHTTKRDFFTNLTGLICLKENTFLPEYQFGHLSLTGKEKLIQSFVSNEKILLLLYDSRAIPYIVSELKNNSFGSRLVKIYIFADGNYPYKEDFISVIDRIELIAMPGALTGALRYVLPQEADYIIDDTDLSDEEKELMANEASETE